MLGVSVLLVPFSISDFLVGIPDYETATTV